MTPPLARDRSPPDSRTVPLDTAPICPLLVAFLCSSFYHCWLSNLSAHKPGSRHFRSPFALLPGLCEVFSHSGFSTFGEFYTSTPIVAPLLHPPWIIAEVFTNRRRFHIHYDFLTVSFLAHPVVSSIVLRLYFSLSYSYLFVIFVYRKFFHPWNCLTH